MTAGLRAISSTSTHSSSLSSTRVGGLLDEPVGEQALRDPIAHQVARDHVEQRALERSAQRPVGERAREHPLHHVGGEAGVEHGIQAR